MKSAEVEALIEESCLNSCHSKKTHTHKHVMTSQKFRFYDIIIYYINSQNSTVQLYKKYEMCIFYWYGNIFFSNLKNFFFHVPCSTIVPVVYDSIITVRSRYESMNLSITFIILMWILILFLPGRVQFTNIHTYDEIMYLSKSTLWWKVSIAWQRWPKS